MVRFVVPLKKCGYKFLQAKQQTRQLGHCPCLRCYDVNAMVARNLTVLSGITGTSALWEMRNTLEAVPEAAGLAFTAPNGEFSCVARKGASYITYIRSFGPDRQLRFFAQSYPSGIYNQTLGHIIASNSSYDPQSESFYLQAIGHSPNTAVWTNAIHGMTADPVIMVSAPYYPPGWPTAVGVFSAGYSLDWLSGLLIELATDSKSVIIAVNGSGELYGSTHGPVVSAFIQNGTMTTKAIQAAASDEHVQATYRNCLVRNKSQFTHRGTEYLCTTERVSDPAKLNIFVVMATPRDYFFGIVDNGKTAARSKLTVGLRLTMGLCALYLVVCICGSAVASLMITRPLRKLSSRMRQVAEFEVEQQEYGVPSQLWEVGEVQTNFAVMIGRLREYKSFMPPPAFLSNAEHDEPEFQLHESASCTSTAVERPVARPRQFARPIIRNSTYVDAETTDTREKRNSTSQADRTLSVGLQLRHGTCLIADTDRFHARLTNCSMREVLELHGMYVEAAAKAVASTGGALESFQGDRLLATWNTFTRAAQHAVAAVKAAIAIQGAVCAMNETCDAAGGQPLAVRIGIASGQIYSGRMGCSGLRAFTSLGKTVVLAHDLCRHARRCRVAMLANSGTHDSTGSVAGLRPVDIVESEPNSPPQLVYEVLNATVPKHDEWLHILENQASDSSTEPFHQAFRAALDRDFAGAVHVMTPRGTSALAMDGSDPVTLYVLSRLRRMLSANAVLPVALKAHGERISNYS
eukprot:TRINITY_DN13004_c0_g2_i3.p1 TRINITY_DN13004_c0_g2~~TRINITY_DN13004_c0_g2_i3.p1  ORF type:complete len:772 (+),score=76.73 TRINITY_DN13004_c0_g2_i3:75-2318(+)